MGILQVLERALKFCIGLCQSGFGMPTGPRASSRRKRTAERPGAILLLGAAGGRARPFGPRQRPITRARSGHRCLHLNLGVLQPCRNFWIIAFAAMEMVKW